MNFQPVLFPLLFFGVIAVVIAASIVAASRKRREIVQQLAALGFAHNPKPDRPAQREAIDRTGHVPVLKTGPVGVRWCASGEVDGQEVSLLEHQFTTGAGKSRQVHTHLVASTPCPPSWPDLSVTQENLFDKIAGLMGRKDLVVESDEFNKRWKVSAANEDFALLVLSTTIQEWAMRLPKAHQLHIGGGALCIVAARPVRPADLPAFCRLPLELAGQLPQELFAWGQEEPAQ